MCVIPFSLKVCYLLPPAHFSAHGEEEGRVRIDKLPFAPVRRRPEPGDYRRAYVLVIT